jgi:nitronate monooxygenase
MPIKTALTALLGIRHPILSAPMDVIAGARLTAAVSAAGGFGILGGGYGDRAWLEQESTKLKQRTAAPFGVGFSDFARTAKLVRRAAGLIQSSIDGSE